MSNNYYETDGCFCSFNCCLAFINDNVHNAMYSSSKHLLMKMYYDIFNKVEKIVMANKNVTGVVGISGWSFMGSGSNKAILFSNFKDIKEPPRFTGWLFLFSE